MASEIIKMVLAAQAAHAAQVANSPEEQHRQRQNSGTQADLKYRQNALRQQAGKTGEGLLGSGGALGGLDVTGRPMATLLGA